MDKKQIADKFYGPIIDIAAEAVRSALEDELRVDCLKVNCAVYGKELYFPGDPRSKSDTTILGVTIADVDDLDLIATNPTSVRQIVNEAAEMFIGFIDSEIQLDQDYGKKAVLAAVEELESIAAELRQHL